MLDPIAITMPRLPSSPLRNGLPENEPADAGLSAEGLYQLGCMLKRSGYAFTTVTPATHQRVNARPGNHQAADAAGIFGWSRPFPPARIDKALLRQMVLAGVLTDLDLPNWRVKVRASTLDGQLYFHSAYPTTERDAVFFGPDTYRFVRALRQQLQHDHRAPRRVADIGCGAGPAAISLALRYPQAQVVAVDINPAALAMTQVNARLAGAANLQASHSNLFSKLEGEFDLIVSNPPYLLDGEQRAYRHGGGALGAGLSLSIVRAALERLAPGGSLMLYTGVAMINGCDPFRAEVETMLSDSGFTWIYDEIDPDVFGEELEQPAYRCTERVAAVWLCASRPEARP